MLIAINKFLQLKFKNKEKILYAKLKIYNYLLKFCENINVEYIKNICNNSKNKILLYTINSKLDSNYNNEIIGFIIFRIIKNSSSNIKINILLLGIHRKMRFYGYGFTLLDEFVNMYKKNKKLEIILLSVKSSIGFYVKNGFTLTNTKLKENTETTDDCKIMIKIY